MCIRTVCEMMARPSYMGRGSDHHMDAGGHGGAVWHPTWGGHPPVLAAAARQPGGHIMEDGAAQPWDIAMHPMEDGTHGDREAMQYAYIHQGIPLPLSMPILPYHAT